MKELTVRELAVAERVTEKTVRRWIEKGAVTTRRTPGGGVRIVVPPRTTVDNSGHPSN